MKEEDKNKSSDKQARVSELCDCDVLFVPVSQTKARVTERTLMLLLLLCFFLVDSWVRHTTQKDVRFITAVIPHCILWCSASSATASKFATMA